tara:strand:- start:228 stop:701 length:474 start_codon:yes stop_codon:yes gene_type:complete
MPNWCNNTITVTGQEKHRQEFVDKNKGFAWNDSKKENEYQALSFNAQVPIPKKHLKAKDNGWYSWCIDNWGTKWNASEIWLQHTDAITIYTFATAWGSPEMWLRKVSRKFANLVFEIKWVEESGEGGYYDVVDGEVFEGRRMSNTEAHSEFYGEDAE